MTAASAYGATNAVVRNPTALDQVVNGLLAAPKEVGNGAGTT